MPHVGRTLAVAAAFVPHTGWAWIVAVAGAAEQPQVVGRERLLVRAGG